ncbi:hypothetical protein [Vibrio porteresiae]|uniref:Phage protein n=1 Tax=Vibrio porteresiae DSM 19223 TaxID=1123496 RepID=A0ABZ0QBP1_9VIBR|nr:hypothetical protein [Vibrio porteresiae]WPC72961.1 hypothetical protein R8Z52_12585 [Vibrio porteresiae DSM 19223]
MNILKNALGIDIPPRPELTDEMKKAGALKAVKSGHLASVSESEAEDFASDIVKHYYSGIDAYDLAKYMDTHGSWDVDSMFVDDMDQVSFYIQDIHREAIKDWADTYQPAPPFELGVELDVRSFEGPSHGVIDRIFEYEPAKYCVKMAGTTEDNTSRRLINFEDAKLRKVAVGDVVEPIKPDYQLASGAQRYERAIVVSTSPFVLISELADMRWESTVKREQFKIIGKATDQQLKECIARL